MAQDSDKKFDVKIELEPSTDSTVPTGQNELSQSIDDYVRDIDRAKKGMSSASSDLEKALSSGYNPNAMMNNSSTKQIQRPPSLAKKDDSKLDDGRSSTGGTSNRDVPLERNNPRESAPDINKDYGSSMPPNNYGQQGSSNNVSRDNGVPTNNPYIGDQDSANNNIGSLPRKNGLEEPNNNETNQFGEKDEDSQQISSHNMQNNEEEKNPEAPNNLDKEKIDRQNTDQTGNGYGALARNESAKAGDKQDRVLQNMEHSKRVQQGNEEERKSSRPLSSGTINENTAPSLGTRIKDSFRNLLSGRAASNDDVSDNSNGRNDRNSNRGFNEALNRAKAALLAFLKANPFIAIVLGVIILFILILMISNLSKNANNNGKCTYSLNGILSTGTVNLEGLQVELVNCDAKPDNYTVLETVDFEKYVVGVALAEVSYSRNNPEYFKTQIVAARNFALTRNKAMCPSHPDDCFYGYNPNTGKIRMRVCTNDQVYCDYDRPCYRMTRDGAAALVSPEVDANTPGAYVWKGQPDEALKEEILSVAEDVKGKVLVDESNNVVYTNYINTDQNEWSKLALEGHTYDEILNIHYGGGSISGATCSSGAGTIDYGDYVLSSDGHTILHEPLDSFLEKQGTSLEEFNSLIEKNVEKAGFGTRAGVVAAAVTLIAELGNNYNVKVPYYWGGGHADGVVIGALGYWGSTQCHTFANNQSYNYCGLDCSGFVPWAIKNGGFNIAQMLAGNFQNMSGVQKVSLSNSAVLEPGDLLESSGHIVLVVGIEESTGNYICAEASGNAAGVLFTRRPFNSSGYWGIKMDGWYSTHQRSEEK